MLLGYPAMDYYSNAYAMNQYLTSRGFIVLSVNYRCGIGYGIEFRDCIHAGADGATEYNDVLAAAKYLRSRPDVDAAHIGIWGGSYGGYLTALALARNSNLFAAGVDFHGVHDWNLEDNASGWRIGSYARRDAIAAKALASSPLADLSHWTSPILLIHGDNDPDVAYAQTPTLADALRARNASLPASAQVDVQELIFPDELHGFLLHKDWLAAYTAAAAFFDRTLMPEASKTK
jgi:dipeptidyl aminopeptidase/acylaminoacyl peptidase